MKRKLLILTLLACSIPLSAQEVVRNEAMAFCRIQTDPQGAGMGYAGRASATAWAAFRNVSATAFLPGTADVAASFQRWAPDGALVPAAAGAARIGRFGFAAGYMACRSPEDAALGFAPADRAFGGGAAYALTGWLSAGAGIRLLQSDLLPDNTLQAVAADLSVTALLGGFRLTAAAADLGRLAAESGRYGLPTSLALAGEWTKSFGPGGSGSCRHASKSRGNASAGQDTHSVRLAADLDWFPVSGSLTAALGGEYGFKGRYFLRCGYHLAAGRAPGAGADGSSAGGWTIGGTAVLPSFATLGAGIRLDDVLCPGFTAIGLRNIRLDLAWLAGGPLGNTLLAGLSMAW